MGILAEQEAKVYQAVLDHQDPLADLGKWVSLDALVLWEIQDTLVIKVGHRKIISQYLFFHFATVVLVFNHTVELHQMAIPVPFTYIFISTQAVIIDDYENVATVVGCCLGYSGCLS